MKLVSQKKALERLQVIISDLKSEISDRYEHRARNCQTCDTLGSCCLDAHFVNVHISRLEAVAIQQFLEKLPKHKQAEVSLRIDAAIRKYSLRAEGDTYAQTYACPLFEQGVGCLVHKTAKPVPCVVHACYEQEADLPPEQIQTAVEKRIATLNIKTYRRSLPLLPLPLALRDQN